MPKKIQEKNADLQDLKNKNQNASDSKEINSEKLTYSKPGVLKSDADCSKNY